jgi:lipopolysaccharide transport system ATP-binding protein
MSSSDLALTVRGLSKSYTIAHNAMEKESTLTETLLKRLKNPFHRPQKETFWALKDINFDVKKGEVLGIIGRHGAGKSTLLKILSRITEPTSGEINLYGRVGSLLEVGTGFHPELTGRENVYLNGAILGMTRAEIRKQFDAIVDFAGVEKFLDTPVKRYSSGMYVRLAFAVAAHLRTEILIVDEVLAVGDVEFQKKCLGKMQDVAQDGRTVLFVSHNVFAVESMCTSALFLTKGNTDGVQKVRTATRRYLQAAEAASVNIAPLGNGVARIAEIRLGTHSDLSGAIRSTDELVVELAVEAREDVPNLAASVNIMLPGGQRAASLWSGFTGDRLQLFTGSNVLRLRADSVPLTPGQYDVDVEIGYDGAGIQYWSHAAVLSVSAADDNPLVRIPDAAVHGALVLGYKWSVKEKR